MSTALKRLQLCNIRSYDENLENNVIEFGKPLTVILGSNGSGKTTIIESLKLVTTGEFPPTDGKKNMIRDPNLTNFNQVKGQVRLLYTDVTGKDWLAVRPMQVTLRAGKLSFKNLDAYVKDVETNTVTTRKSADMAKLLPASLGVSKAMLENVIFCHQEDINWPLKTSQKLKEKFDDIFESTRYAKAIDKFGAIEKLRKNGLDSSSKLLEEKKKRKRDYDHMCKELADYETCQASLELDIQHLDLSITECKTKIEEYEGCEERIQSLTQSIGRLESVKKEKKKTLKRLKESAGDLFEDLSLEALKKDIAEFEKTDSQKKKRSILRSIDQMDRNREELWKKKSLIEGEGVRMEKEKAELKKKISLWSKEFGLDIQADMSIESLTKNLDIMKKYSRKLMTSRDEITSKLNFEIEEKQKEIYALNQTLDSLENEKNNYLQEKSNLNHSMSVLDKNLATIQVCGTLDIETLEGNIQAIQDQIREKKEILNRKSVDLNNSKNERKRIEEERSLIQKQKDQRQEEIILFREIERLESAIAEKKETIQKKFDSFKDNARRLDFMESLSEMDLTLDNALPRVKSIKSEISKDIDLCSDKIRNLKATNSTLHKSILKSQKLVSTLEKSVQKDQNEMNKKEYDDVKSQPKGNLIQQAEEMHNNCTKESALQNCYEVFIKESQQNHACPVCERSFKPKELESFISQQNRKLESFSEVIARLTEAYEKAKLSLDVLKRFEEVKERLAQRKLELKTHREELNGLQDNLSNGKNSLKELNVEMKSLQERFDRVQTLISELEELDRYAKDQRSKEKERELKVEKTKQFLAHTTSIEDLEKEIEKTCRNYKEIEKTIEQFDSDFAGIRKEIDVLSTKLEESKENLQKFLKRQDLLKQKGVMQSKIALITKKLGAMPELHLLQPQIDELEREVTKIKEKRSESQRCSEESIRNVDSSIAELKRKIKLLNAYLSKDKLELPTVLQNFNEVKENLSRKKSELDQLEHSIKMYEEKKDCIRLRKEYSEYQEISKKIQALTDEKYEIIETEQTITSTEYDNFVETLKKAENDRAETFGQLRANQASVLKLRERLDTSSSKNISKEFQECMIQVNLAQKVLDDLRKYKSALERVMLQFHSKKMEEINGNIKQLWQSTYQGDDIDTILIRADSGKGKRSAYQYRVVMSKNGVELDLRGRCSAGQRVLACLVIRLALAEAFCIDCGILALDEPTQNLDVENVKALSKALQNLIKERKHQNNFQLIIITHDEQFVEQMGRSEYLDHYYRITKDPTREDHNSIISKIPFNQAQFS